MIKNYTSQVPVARSISYIEAKLVMHGALDIMKRYEGQELQAISFIISVNGRKVPFKLPARTANVEKVLRGARTRTPESKIKEQAARTAWKLVSDWVDIQMALIELKQVDIMEVFLPYIFYPDKDGGLTLYEKLSASQFKVLQIPEVT